MTWPRNAEDRPGGQLGRPSKGKRDNQSAPNLSSTDASSQYSPQLLRVEDLTDTIRDRVHALSDQVDDELDADRRFFVRWPHRSYYVRRSFRAEAETMRLLMDDVPLPPGVALFTVVHQGAPGCRLRAFLVAGRGLDTDMSDAEAACLFDALVDAGFVARFRAAVAKGQAERRA